MTSLRIGTRSSPLALAQTEIVRKALSPYCKKIEVIQVKTSGDATDIPLTEIGGKALFLKELEGSLLKDEIDIAVHSMKDVPAFYHPDLQVVPVLKRASHNDVFISFYYSNMASMPDGARIGSCSPRRVIQLDRRFQSTPLRGSIGTRIEKAKNLDGIILALCGIERLGITDFVSEVLHEDLMIPAVGQGTLAVELKRNNHWVAELISKIFDEETTTCAIAERAFLEEINGDCKTALGGLATMRGDILHFKGMLGKGNQPFFVEKSGPARDAARIGRCAASELLTKRARES
ncbi:porphobilinogen deaminase [Neorickettsia helminthoeca str. Oregon]|uniref:Hydroxymethylbilane synthase n=1 Tax=Neorickettsia helminthoeca str. Oregon TaxID=1286528 RepID=X5H3P5_9RICK|nr:hydroxymethylbilane synthase [Neorickettsia helminthoeca]AHX11318.1 porphobilinogen deaminase [Neorickettsia helminthoeca str. Oregon]